MSGRSGSRTAPHTLLATIGGTHTYRVTKTQARLIAAAQKAGGLIFVAGREVVAARQLESLHLGTLEDDGRMGRGGNADGERWVFKVNDGVTLNAAAIAAGTGVM